METNIAWVARSATEAGQQLITRTADRPYGRLSEDDKPPLVGPNMGITVGVSDCKDSIIDDWARLCR
jgi:hypothetical protein